jgi:hypothetical protein
MKMLLKTTLSNGIVRSSYCWGKNDKWSRKGIYDCSVISSSANSGVLGVCRCFNLDKKSSRNKMGE